MPRPPLDVGTYGSITVRRTGSNRFEARARFRMSDGSLKLVGRVGASSAKATANLKRALSELTSDSAQGAVSGEMRMKTLANMWHDELAREMQIGGRSHGTIRIYRSVLDNWVIPAVGALRVREISVMACDRLIKNVHDRTSYDTAKSVRTVLSAVCGYAVRHGAMTVNPVHSVARLVRGDQRQVRALDASERTDLLVRLEQLADRRGLDSRGRRLGARAKVWSDLPDVVRAMLATGVRLGELLALSGTDVDVIQHTLAVDHHLVRVTGSGLVRVATRKGGSKGLLLKLPVWSVSMFRQRKLAAGEGPLFPSANGEWLDPSNVTHRIREAFSDCGYSWVTSHVFRKTVATVLDEADLPLSALADQLGNTQTVADKHYRRRRVANEASAAALEDILSDSSRNERK